MATMNNRLTALALGLVVTAFASPSLAQVSDARAAAIHACNVAADKYPEYIWGDTQSDVYRACMAEHGQQE